MARAIEYGRSNGFSVYQWVSMMITMITIGIGSVIYINKIGERVSVLESNCVIFKSELESTKKTVNDGMQMRIILQGDVKYMREQLDRIEESIMKHVDKERSCNKGISITQETVGVSGG